MSPASHAPHTSLPNILIPSCMQLWSCPGDSRVKVEAQRKMDLHPQGENMGVMGLNSLLSVSVLGDITILGYPILAVLKTQRVTLVESA